MSAAPSACPTYPWPWASPMLRTWCRIRYAAAATSWRRSAFTVVVIEISLLGVLLGVGQRGLGGGGLLGQLTLARPPGLGGDQCGAQADRGVGAEQQGRADPAERDEQQRG